MDWVIYIMLGVIVVLVCALFGIGFLFAWALGYPDGKINKWLLEGYRGGKADSSGATTAAAASVIVTSSFTR